MSSNQLVGWFWMQDRITKQLVLLPSIIPELLARPSHPLQCWKLGAAPSSIYFCFLTQLDSFESNKGLGGASFSIDFGVLIYVIGSPYPFTNDPNSCTILLPGSNSNGNPFVDFGLLGNTYSFVGLNFSKVGCVTTLFAIV